MAASLFQNHAELFCALLCAVFCVCWGGGRLAAIAEKYVSSSSECKENGPKESDFESLSEKEIVMSGQLCERFPKSTKCPYDNE